MPVASAAAGTGEVSVVSVATAVAVLSSAGAPGKNSAAGRESRSGGRTGTISCGISSSGGRRRVLRRWDRREPRRPCGTSTPAGASAAGRGSSRQATATCGGRSISTGLVSAAATEWTSNGTTNRDRGSNRHGLGAVGEKAERIAIVRVYPPMRSQTRQTTDPPDHGPAARAAQRAREWNAKATTSGGPASGRSGSVRR